MKRHILWMIVGCGLPLVLLFLLPAFGIDSDISVLGFLVLMFGCHLIHLGAHASGSEPNHHDG